MVGVDTAAELIKQHADLLIQIERLWTVLVVLAFVGLAFILVMIFAAVWSVRTVLRQFDRTQKKWDEVIQLLLASARHQRLHDDDR